ncbi:S41 family peptidase [Ramlibacter agri]|nr:S41 family peptidase [Ramlibacter agri]
MGRAAAGALLALAATSVFSQTSRKPLPLDQLQVLAAAYQVLQDSLVYRPDDKALVVSAVKGMLKGADPESGEYFDQQEFDEFKRPPERTGASGLEVRLRDGQFLLTPLENGPAAEAGVQFGDQLHAIDGARVKGLDLHMIVRQLSGAAGSKLTLTVFRERELKVLEFTIERKPYAPPGPALTVLPSGVALLRIPQFRERTLQEASTALLDAWNRQPFRAVILDLRASPGGLLDVAVGIASIFLPRDVTVARMTGAPATSNFVYKSSKEFYLRHGGADPLEALPVALRELPVTVLVDGATASGAEIVATALQDNRRANVVGRTTFGRGSIQTITPLSIGAIKYTSAYWQSPNGHKIQGAGVTPDTVVDDPWAASTVDAVARDLLSKKVAKP